jgi:hypothetical protein
MGAVRDVAIRLIEAAAGETDEGALIHERGLATVRNIGLVRGKQRARRERAVSGAAA